MGFRKIRWSYFAGMALITVAAYCIYKIFLINIFFKNKCILLFIGKKQTNKKFFFQQNNFDIRSPAKEDIFYNKFVFLEINPQKK